jgi:hypothetical protein
MTDSYCDTKSQNTFAKHIRVPSGILEKPEEWDQAMEYVGWRIRLLLIVTSPIRITKVWTLELPRCLLTKQEKRQ